MADKKKGVSLTVGVMHGGPPPVRGLHEPPPEPDADDQGGGTSANNADDQGVKPEWVNYTTEAERCNSCNYMGDDGTCAVLNMTVQPGDHCEAWEGAEAAGGGAPQGPEPTGGGGGFGQ